MTHRRARCGCTDTVLCAACQRLLARSEGRASLPTGWTAADTSTGLQRRILHTHLPRLLYWRGYHTHDSRKSAPGFPDLVLLRTPPRNSGFLAMQPRMVVVELKNAGEHPTREQQDWLECFWVQGAEVYIWVPNDEPAICEVLLADVVHPRSREWFDRVAHPLVHCQQP